MRQRGAAGAYGRSSPDAPDAPQEGFRDLSTAARTTSVMGRSPSRVRVRGKTDNTDLRE